MQEKQEQLLFYSDPWDNSGFYVGTQRQGKFPEFVCGSRLPSHFSRDFLSFQPGMCRPRVQVGAEIPSEKRQEMEQRERKKKIPGKFGGFGIIFPLPSLFFPPSSFGGKAAKSKFNSMPRGCRWNWIFGFGPRDFWEFPKSPQIPFIPRSFPDIPLASKAPGGVQEFPGG